jgi:hypothetical protein
MVGVMRPIQSGKVTLIELGFLAFNIFFISLVVQWAYHRYGWRGVAGFFGVYVVLPFSGFGFVYLMALIYTGNPYYPACRTGKCHRWDYQQRRLDNGKHAVCCQCGTLYRKRGRRFFEVQPDGSLCPYMVWRAFRGWFPDG